MVDFISNPVMKFEDSPVEEYKQTNKKCSNLMGRLAPVQPGPLAPPAPLVYSRWARSKQGLPSRWCRGGQEGAHLAGGEGALRLVHHLPEGEGWMLSKALHHRFQGSGDESFKIVLKVDLVLKPHLSR